MDEDTQIRLLSILKTQFDVMNSILNTLEKLVDLVKIHDRTMRNDFLNTSDDTTMLIN